MSNIFFNVNSNTFKNKMFVKKCKLTEFNSVYCKLHEFCYTKIMSSMLMLKTLLAMHLHFLL